MILIRQMMSGKKKCWQATSDVAWPLYGISRMPNLESVGVDDKLEIHRTR